MNLSPSCWICPEPVDSEDAATVHIECAEGRTSKAVLERVRARVPQPPPHIHEFGCGHAGEGITPDYQRGWSAGRAYAKEQVRVILDEEAARV